MARVQSFASEMRRNPTEPERRLWANLSRSQLGGFKFRRQATIGAFIADFLCPAVRLVVEIDGHTHGDAVADQSRDAALHVLGYRTIRFTNTDVMQNLEGVLVRLLAELQSLPLCRAPHPNPSPEGEGLER
ncbi:endonuclease domain-containing protein [Sphingomonas sp. KR1UV-12]|uniref:Endonuclease domain-containing protein n=1 Tax=Sphingomonas aurea TaxID=3063994 RepID=A0ABT9ENH4_9SPHN|nr:endonuclease domain-containing protein [Sphingomonas sp. KR1UV-12]MDP1028491.1 endonuclease domain-containing protein [Sphingomonas sp. KR1UV-12]